MRMFQPAWTLGHFICVRWHDVGQDGAAIGCAAQMATLTH